MATAVVVHVTRAQVLAANALIELRARTSKPVSATVRKIANAGRDS